jgi:DtxR family transcriptional regulator, Mn-dependent transcriptional regulator
VRKEKHNSESVENFLKAVYTLQQDLPTEEERVATNALSEHLSISAPSVTDMAQRLTEQGFLDYQRYKGVKLTSEGERIALKMLRRHRLIELFLVQELGYALQEVHQEAEALEHAVSDIFVEALAKKLGNPSFDPHGDPIPTLEGVFPQIPTLALSELDLQKNARVSRFIPNSGELLQYILDKGFKLNATVCMLSREPFEGPVTLLLEGESLTIGFNVAKVILVEVV